MSHWSIVEADVVEALREMEDDSMDAALLDPPYGLGSKAPTVPEIVAFLTADKDERAYVAIANARLARWDDVPAAMDEAEAVRESRTQLKAVDPRQASLFEVAK